MRPARPVLLLHGRGRGERKPYGERAALALAAFNGDGAAMLLDDLFACRQPDAAAPDATDGVPRPLEALEHSRLVGRRDADAAVLHRQHCLPCLRPHANRDLATVRAVLDGVREQIAQHAFETGHVPLAHQLGLRHAQRELVVVRRSLLGSDGTTCKGHQVGGHAVERQRFAQTQTRNVQQVIDQSRHLVDRADDIGQG